MKSENNMSEGIVIGRNPVIELLNAKKILILFTLLKVVEQDL